MLQNSQAPLLHSGWNRPLDPPPPLLEQSYQITWPLLITSGLLIRILDLLQQNLDQGGKSNEKRTDLQKESALIYSFECFLPVCNGIFSEVAVLYNVYQDIYFFNVSNFVLDQQ